MQIDIRIAQLLCSRLCHDLVGISGAVNAGLELLQDPGALAEDGPDGPLGLVSDSARQINSRLSYYRVAFGFGGGQGGHIELVTLRQLCADFFADGSVNLDWPDQDADGVPDSLTSGAGKLLLNIILLGGECLLRGGTLSVRLAAVDDGLAAAVSANGPSARLKEDTLKAIDAGIPPEALTAYSVQGHFTSLLAAYQGGDIEIDDSSENVVRLAVML